MENEREKFYGDGLSNGFKFGFLIGVITYIITFEILLYLSH
jgi:hypothetical protein